MVSKDNLRTGTKNKITSKVRRITMRSHSGRMFILFYFFKSLKFTISKERLHNALLYTMCERNYFTTSVTVPNKLSLVAVLSSKSMILQF